MDLCGINLRWLTSIPEVDRRFFQIQGSKYKPDPILLLEPILCTEYIAYRNDGYITLIYLDITLLVRHYLYHVLHIYPYLSIYVSPPAVSVIFSARV